MLARLYVFTPFSLTIPEGEQFPIYEYEDNGIKIRSYPPDQSPKLKERNKSDQEIKINGIPTIAADVFRIDFQRDSFDRSENSPCDPPIEIMDRALNSVLIRLRYVVRASAIHPIKLASLPWHLVYLNDDETELEVSKGGFRGRGSNRYSIECVALTKNIWADIQALPIDFQPPPWDGLLLDAIGELPRVGTAIVLAATALEVFISQVMEQMAPRSQIPEKFWKWSNKRADISKNPSIEEQYDVLLSLMTGHSLKDEKSLWEAFKNLKTARNNFVHEGVAKLGGSIVTPESARLMVGGAVEIIQKVREWLPEEIHWPEYKYELQYQVSQKLV